MARHGTFGVRLGAGLAVTVALALGMGAVAVHALRGAVSSKDRVIHGSAQRLVAARTLQSHFEARSAALRGFLLSREESFDEQRAAERAKFDEVREELQRAEGSPEELRLLSVLDRISREYAELADQVSALRRHDASIDTVGRAFEAQVLPKRREFEVALLQLLERSTQRLHEEESAASEAAAAAELQIAAIASGAACFSAAVALGLSRMLREQIGAAAVQIESCCGELDSASTPQRDGEQERSTALAQMGPTLAGLRARLRPIPDGARHEPQGAVWP